MKIISIGGMEFVELELLEGSKSELGRILVPHDPETQKKEFPVDGNFLSSAFTASRGISLHILDFHSTFDSNNSLPQPHSGTGFSAARLNILGDDNFYPECWQVLEANGWMAPGYGQISQKIFDEVCARDGFPLGSGFITRT